MGFSGYRIGNTTIGITQMPDRKRPCLYVMKGNTLYPVAYFTKYEFAEMFAEELERFFTLLAPKMRRDNRKGEHNGQRNEMPRKQEGRR